MYSELFNFAFDSWFNLGSAFFQICQIASYALSRLWIEKLSVRHLCFPPLEKICTGTPGYKYKVISTFTL